MSDTLLKGLPTEWPCELLRLIGEEANDDAWSSVLERIASHPEEVKFQGKFFGQTALHGACFRYPPLHVVQALLLAAPENALKQNNDGETPLHIACNCAGEGVQLELIARAPQAVALQDKYGECPLHIAARNGATRAVLEQMLQATSPSPPPIGLKNNRGVTPFSLLSRNYVQATSLEEIQEEDNDYIDDWETALLFLRAAEPAKTPSPKSNTSPLPLVHLAAMTPSCPRPLLMMLLKFYPEQALQYDSEGMTPLHYAASATAVPIQEPRVWNETEDGYRHLGQETEMTSVRNPIDASLSSDWSSSSAGRLGVPLNDFLIEQVSNSYNNDEYNENDDEEEEIPFHSVILLLVNWNPAAVRYLDKRNRQLPLHMALLLGKSWRDDLQHMVWAAPQSLETRDSTNGLYPFQSAAVHGCDVNTIYHLIRSYPQCLTLNCKKR